MRTWLSKSPAQTAIATWSTNINPGGSSALSSENMVSEILSVEFVAGIIICFQLLTEDCLFVNDAGVGVKDT
jgi:hypothetical protein